MSHGIKVERCTNGWIAICSCGWESLPQKTEGAAWTDSGFHDMSDASVVTPAGMIQREVKGLDRLVTVLERIATALEQGRLPNDEKCFICGGNGKIIPIDGTVPYLCPRCKGMGGARAGS